MTTALLGVDELIATDENGRAYLAGRRISVAWIGALWNQGLSDREIVDDVFAGTVTLAQVHAALAFYHRNREAIDADRSAMDAEYDRRMAESESLVTRP